MSTSYKQQDLTARLGFKSRLWRGLKAIATRRLLLVPQPDRQLPQRSIRKQNPSTSSSPSPSPSAMQAGTRAATTTNTILHAGAGAKANPADWFPVYQNCVEYFVNVAQYQPIVQSLAAHINILLPYQHTHATYSEQVSSRTQPDSPNSPASLSKGQPIISLTPYIQRLVVTATDTPAIMQEMFGENWVQGVGQVQAQERMNYLFAAKSGGWLKTKAQYDISPLETVPFLRPLREPQEEELHAAETQWSEWLAMEDWMLGPRSPFEDRN